MAENTAVTRTELEQMFMWAARGGAVPDIDVAADVAAWREAQGIETSGTATAAQEASRREAAEMEAEFPEVTVWM
jgi:hypothetical protein